MTHVEFARVSKVYADGTRAVSDLDLVIDAGELLVLVGPSGCGKTTALRMVAGLEEVSDGRILLGDRDITRVPSRDRDVAMVFQSYALYPHLTVADNIGFGLKLRKVPKAEIRERVERVAATLGLTEQLDRRPRNLSGGQRQRVAMGRAIVREPSVFLMDEPLSNLDAKLRVQMRAEIARLQQRLGVTTIYVTHDQTEAMTLGTRVAVMRRGVLQQVGPPQELYDRPTNVFVAGFIGSPAMNLLEGRVERGADGTAVRVGSWTLPLGPSHEASLGGAAGTDGSPIVVGIRPEDLHDASLGAPPGTEVDADVDLVEAMGSDVIVHFDVAAGHPVIDDAQPTDDGLPAEPGDGSGATPEGTTVVARLNPRTGARVGHPIRLVVDTARLHLFDPTTGAALAEPAMATTQGGAP